jgi:hypothetical protein
LIATKYLLFRGQDTSWNDEAAMLNPRHQVAARPNSTMLLFLGSSTSQAVWLVSIPIVAEAAVKRMVHFISRVLRELQVQIVVPEPDNFYTGFDKHPRQLRSLLGGAATTNIAHQERGRPRIRFATAPETSFAEFPYANAKPVYV